MMRRTLPLLAVLLATVLVGAHAAPDHAEHLRLERSAPATDTTVSTPAEIRLWFSQATQEDATSIRLVDGDGELVELGDVTPAEGRTVHFASVSGPLAAGSYTVAWRTMAADGHVVRGDFSFAVTSTR